MIRSALGVAAALALGGAWGCGEGEVTGLVLPVLPDNGEQFVAAQQAMLDIGCSLPGCHGAIVGNFKVSADPGARGEEYLLTKPFVDLRDPDASLLLRKALAQDPAAVGHAICFANTEGCAWRIITAWIREGTFDVDADGNPLVSATAVAAECTPTPNACRTGGD